MSNASDTVALRLGAAGFLAWLMPGLGHIYLGHRTRGLIFMVTIGLTFWAGMVIGGVRTTVNPTTQKWWFLAQLCTGSHALAGVALSRSAQPPATAPPPGLRHAPQPPAYTGHWLGLDVGTNYTGVAGLLNVLVILDALLRAQILEPRRGAQPTAEPTGG